MLIKNANIIYPDKVQYGSLQVKDGIITEIDPPEETGSDVEVVDAGGLYLSPGFIDIHIHGAGGRDTMEGSREAVCVIGRAIASHGTTSFVPTTMTMDVPTIRRAIKEASSLRGLKTGGANVIGLHMEGPFINPKKAGAQDTRFVLEPSIKVLEDLTCDMEEGLIYVTLAPEMPGSMDMISHLTERGIRVSIGHTCADYETTMKAVSHGASHATHLYNAMTPFSHREPGVIGAVFDSMASAQIIADGIHVSWPAIRIALKQIGTDRAILITDAMKGCVMPEGTYDLGGQPVLIRNQEARLEDGTLAGSVLTMDRAVRNVKNHTTCPLHEIVRMATRNPAVFCGIGDRKGTIAPGFDADLILFDEEIQIKKVLIGGKDYE